MAISKKEQYKRYAIFGICMTYMLVLFLRNFPTSGMLGEFSRISGPYTNGIGVNHFGWNMFAGGNGITTNQLARLRFTTEAGQTYYETLIQDTTTYKRTAWKEFSYKVLQGDSRIRDGYLGWYCRNGYGGLSLQSVAIEQAFVPLDDWIRANHTYLTPPQYTEVVQTTCSVQNI